MSIFNGKEYINRYDAGQEAINNSNWRIAYDCFMDCKEYLKRESPWEVSKIEHLEYLIEMCNKKFN